MKSTNLKTLSLAATARIQHCSGAGTDQSGVQAKDLMKARHGLWMAKYPNTPEARDFPLQGIENARPETKALGQPRMNGKDLPFAPLETIKQLKGWEGSEIDQAE